MGLRYALVPCLAIIALYLGLSSFMKKPADTATPATVADAAIAQPAANNGAASGVNNLKSAFEATPAAPGYQYGAPAQPATIAAIPHKTGRIALMSDEDVSTVAAGADMTGQQAAAIAPAAGDAAPMLSRQLSAIQSGIHKILQAGSNFVFQRRVSVGKGDTLMDLLMKNNVPRDDAYNAIEALRKVYNPRDLNVGHEITVFFHNAPQDADPEFSGLRIQKDLVSSVSVKRGDDGSFKAREAEKPMHRVLRAFSGTIDNSLYVSAKAAGAPDAVIVEMIKTYSWVVDFQREIQGGDKFDVLYEDFVTDDGRSVPGRGNILYMNLDLKSHASLPLYRYVDAQGNVGYYDPTGQSVKKPLMKTPVNGARISSSFGMRFHPVLGYSKMHKGIDFAVPRGTPIYAAGDGVIERIGPWSSYGNYIRIRHRRGLETAYAHMQGFRAGLRRGSHVTQGQVIGYVGTTGRSTGPHVHYEILINGKQVNPATVKVAGGSALGGKDLRKFKNEVEKIKDEFHDLRQARSAPAMAAVKAATTTATPAVH
jgi:murein DD-endopeptidase MepM/ murein hydrolase activator NlpD